MSKMYSPNQVPKFLHLALHNIFLSPVISLGFNASPKVISLTLAEKLDLGVLKGADRDDGIRFAARVSERSLKGHIADFG